MMCDGGGGGGYVITRYLSFALVLSDNLGIVVYN